MDMHIRTIYLAGGCFWGVEALMRRMPGVTDTCVGYANGTGAADATYESVCSGTTGFRETVRVRFDPVVISVEVLVSALLSVIDPTAHNRQGADVGTQYQAGVFWDAGDDETADDVRRVLGTASARIDGFAVEQGPLRNFFAAEDYHQDYLEKNPGGYCHIPRSSIDALTSFRTAPSQ